MNHAFPILSSSVMLSRDKMISASSTPSPSAWILIVPFISSDSDRTTPRNIGASGDEW